MSRHFYSLLLYLMLPAVLMRLWWRSLRAPEYRHRLGERLALYPADREPQAEGPVVFHAVSVGEVHAALPLVHAWQARHPEWPVVVTCSTPTGSARIRAQFGETVDHVYLPYDLPGAVNRFLDRFRPRLLVMLETELWPNLIHHARRQGIPLLLASARLSDRSRLGYARINRLTREMLGAIDLVAAQSRIDADRLCSLGLEPARVEVTGTLKFDLEVDATQISRGRALREACFGDRPVLIAASTREGEDARVLEAYRLLHDSETRPVLVLVPRHPERFESAAALFREAGFRVAMRTGLDGEMDRDMDVLVGDTMGEMQCYYSMADIAFVGGSLVDTGCQNILEPAALGLPVVTGPSLYNFQAVSDALRAAGAQRVVADAPDLAREVDLLLRDPARREAMASAARQLVAGSAGATRRVVELMGRLTEQG